MFVVLLLVMRHGKASSIRLAHAPSEMTDIVDGNGSFDRISRCARLAFDRNVKKCSWVLLLVIRGKTLIMLHLRPLAPMTNCRDHGNYGPVIFQRADV